MTFWSAKETWKSDVVLPFCLERLENMICPGVPWRRDVCGGGW